MIQSVYSLSSIQVHLQHYMEELTTVTKNLLFFNEASNDDMRKNITSRFSLLNDKAEDEIKSLNIIMDNQVGEKIAESIQEQNNAFEIKLKEVENRAQNYTEKRTRALDAKFKRELETQVQGIVKKSMTVPNLIGEGAQYTTFAGFI